MKLISKLTIWAITITLFSCNNVPYKKEAIALNDSAVALMHKNMDGALLLFDKSYATDSSYLLPIQNKTNLLIKEEKYEEAINSLNILITRIPSPQTWIMKGILLEKRDLKQEANAAFNQGLRLQQDLLDKSPDMHKGTHEINMAFTYFMLDDTNKTKELILKNPKNLAKIPLADSILRYLNQKDKVINLFLKPN